MMCRSAPKFGSSRESHRGSSMPLEWPRVRTMSLSMPITPDLNSTGPLVENYFDNLLPDVERIRRRVATGYKPGSTGTFELVQAH